MFNVPESTDKDEKVNYKVDIDKLKKIFKGKVVIEPKDIKTVYRIGKNQVLIRGHL